MLLFAASAAPRCCCAASISPSCDPPHQLIAVDTRLRVCRLAVVAVAVLTLAVDTCSPVCRLAVIAVAAVCSNVPRGTRHRVRSVGEEMTTAPGLFLRGLPATDYR